MLCSSLLYPTLSTFTNKHKFFIIRFYSPIILNHSDRRHYCNEYDNFGSSSLLACLSYGPLYIQKFLILIFILTNRNQHFCFVVSCFYFLLCFLLPPRFPHYTNFSYQILCPQKLKGVADPKKCAGFILESTPLAEDNYRLGNTKA